MEEKSSILVNQVLHFNSSIEEVSTAYMKLASKRINDELSKDEYMLYDMMDMFIPLQSVAHEISKLNGDFYPDYLIEKLCRVKSYVDTTLAYFEKKSKESK